MNRTPPADDPQLAAKIAAKATLDGARLQAAAARHQAERSWLGVKLTVAGSAFASLLLVISQALGLGPGTPAPQPPQGGVSNTAVCKVPHSDSTQAIETYGKQRDDKLISDEQYRVLVDDVVRDQVDDENVPC